MSYPIQLHVIKLPGIAVHPDNIKTLGMTVLIAIAVLLPTLIQFQPVTGAGVNATLFIAAVLLGTTRAVIVGFVPSIIALATGHLPFVLAPMIPFIILANIALVVVFNAVWHKGFFVGVACAAYVKFFLLQATVLFLGTNILSGVPDAILMMMSWPQLFTALAGGVIAYLILQGISKGKRA